VNYSYLTSARASLRKESFSKRYKIHVFKFGIDEFEKPGRYTTTSKGEIVWPTALNTN